MKTSRKHNYILVPDFLNWDFTKREGVEKMVVTLYKQKRLDLLVSLFRFLEPNSNYLIEHRDTSGETKNILFEFYYSYSSQENKWVEDEKLTEYHQKIDINIFNSHLEKLIEIQTELNDIYTGIKNAEELNQNIVNAFGTDSSQDVQKVWQQHQKLYNDAHEKIYFEIQDSLSEQLKKIDCNYLEELDEIKLTNDYYSENFSLETEVLKYIQHQESITKSQNIPPFDFKKYKEILELQKSPHLDTNNQDYLIAQFAGDKTWKLKEKLREINYTIGSPIRNPVTGVWNYTIDDTKNFIGILYSHLLEYVQSMREHLGFLPKCSWCGRSFQPTSQQLRRLKENHNVYCSYDIDKITGKSICQMKGTANKQNQRRKINKLN
ncbi:hypothetical protein [Caryophanon latum]|uniref:Uncharacterized protein n=1 Tax=Caryophanon latum TaxID=33977 RepID=A0A1C0YX70_9BACL|nr:hypothetical protein [Caryophanon latum]OCS91758.1 hypothetical protein A6K76_01195 [Caryophanon latum]